MSVPPLNHRPQETPDPPLTVVSSIRDFAPWFRLGLPVLMYHKLGPKAPGTRMKGLYVSQQLFASQLVGLTREHFTTPDYGRLVSRTEPGRHVFLTFDDGFENVHRHGLPALRQHGHRAIEFLVANKLGGTNDWETSTGESEERLMDASQVREWLAAGNEIGSHTLTHPRLTEIPADTARKEIGDSRKQLEDLFGVPVKHFCYPFGDHNERIVDLVREAGYETGSTTTPGLNTVNTDPFQIRRIMARHGSRKLRDVRQRWSLRFKRWLHR